jgi:hypothetical protein
MDISFLGSSKREIKNMNEGKVGAPFEYPHCKKTTLRISLGFLAHAKDCIQYSIEHVKKKYVHLMNYCRKCRIPL